MLHIPKEYILAKFKQYSGRPILKGRNWNAACPVCREGKHWNDKRRLFYMVQDEYLYCHNCSESWTPYQWIQEITGMDYTQICAEIASEGYDFFEDIDAPVVIKKESPNLPSCTIDLANPSQLEFFKNDRVVKDALKVIKDRRLDTAIGKAPHYFVSLEDFKFKNRLIIPYYEYSEIVFFTARGLYTKQSPKYLNKYGEKEIFNFQKVDESYPYIFAFEGQIDSMFLPNGVGVSGTILTDYQRKKIEHRYPDHKLIWIMDNPKCDETAQKKIRVNASEDPNYQCFIYPDSFATHKDFNSYAVANRLDQIDPAYIVANSKKGNSLLLSL